MKYFETVFTKQNHIIEIDAPVILQEVAIIKDTVDDVIQLRNIFYNRSSHVIIAIAIRITQSTVFGDPIAEPFEYVYEDIISEPSELFGNKIAIDLHPKARKAQVEILRAVFQDGTVWVSDKKKNVNIQSQHEIEASDEFISSIDDNPIIPMFYYVENDSCWQCTCGEPNLCDSFECNRCKRTRESVKQTFNQSNIKYLFSEYLKEKNKREKELNDQHEGKLNKETKEISNSNISNQYSSTGKGKKKAAKPLIYTLLTIAILLTVFILIVLFSDSKKNDNDDTLVFQNSMFIQSNEIYKDFESTMLDVLGPDYTSGTTEDGFLGFSRKGDTQYNYLIECDNEDMIGLKRNETSCPYSIIFYDTTTPKYDINSIAYFVKCFEKNMKYEDIVNHLNSRAKNLPDGVFTNDMNFPFNGKLYYLIKSTVQSELSLVSVISTSFDYTNIEAKEALKYIFYKDERSIEKAEQLSEEKASELIEFYRNHEQEYYKTIDDLVKASE